MNPRAIRVDIAVRVDRQLPPTDPETMADQRLQLLLQLKLDGLARLFERRLNDLLTEDRDGRRIGTAGGGAG